MRSGSRSRRSRKRGGSLPLGTIALFLGVIVVGLGIGAAISLLNSRGPSPVPVAIVTAVPSSASAVETTDAPVVPRQIVATARPHARPARTPRPASPVPLPSVHPAASSHPSSAADVSAAPVALAPGEAASSEVTPDAAARTPHATSAAAAPVAAAQTAAPASHAPVSESGVAAATAAVTTVSPFARAATDVVRQYLNALMSGDEATARDTLTDQKSELTEEALLDKTSKIRDVEAHGTDENAEVTLVIDTPGGSYNARYFLVKSAAGSPLIRAHAVSKQ